MKYFNEVGDGLGWDFSKRAVGRMFMLAGLLLATTLASTLALSAQTTNADLSGIVVDATGARLPHVKVKLQNDKTKDIRNAVTNKEGVYQFVAVPSDTYTLTLTGVGFGAVEETGIELHPGDQRSLQDLVMRPGAEASITVTASTNDILESGEQSRLISKEDIAHLSIEGRDVTELVKILPGFARNVSGGTGLDNSNGNSVGVSLSGQADGYAANGSPEGGVGLITDGANIQDPGAAGAATQTINMDMVEEVKVQTSNFGAESAKGPIVINAVGKSGSNVFHGSVYLIANASPMNSQDWLSNYFHLTKPTDRYLYPGANVGGPVVIPHTNFNHNKKLTFFVGGEDYIQKNVFAGGSASSALRLSSVPSDRMRAGDWSTAALAQWLGNLPINPTTGNIAGCAPTSAADLTLSNFQSVCLQPLGTDAKGVAITNGQILNFDPGAAAYYNILPHANRAPDNLAPLGNITDGLNRQDLYLFDNNLWQTRARLDYAFSDTTKLYGVYSIEQGQGYGPANIYYSPANFVRNPSLNVGDVSSQTGQLNFTKVLSASMTNELFVAGSFYYNPYHAQNEAANTAAAFGYPYGGILATGSIQLPQLGYSSIGGTLPLYQGPDFSFGPIYARKLSLDAGDNLTLIVKSHTLKIGVYAENVSNNQVNAEPTQGSLAQYGTYSGFRIINPNVPGNAVLTSNPNNALAEFFLGFVNNFSQQTSQPRLDMHYGVLDGFVSDSWKVNKQLTLTLGVRLEHLGPWIDSKGTGLAVWQPQNYGTVTATQVVTINTLPGISWHALNSALPVAGRPTRWAFVSPRVGFSYDVAGNGHTVIGGGWGEYRSHDSWNDYEGALATSSGSFSEGINGITLHCADAFGKGLLNTTSTAAGGNYADCGTVGVNLIPGSVAYGASTQTAIDPTDNQQPDSYTYSLTVSQQIGNKSLFKIGYAGSENAHILVRGSLQNINTVPFGGLFQPDPNPNSPYYGQVQAPDSINQVSDYRQYPFYGGINLLRHNQHTNYNSLQTSWDRRTGRFLYGFNYTWSRAEGDLGAIGRSIPDNTNKANDRGVLNYDRTHIFNATYTIQVGNVWHRNAIVGGFVNGWEISGITNLQSGPNLQSATSSNFSLAANYVNTQTFTQVNIPGVPNIETDNKSFLGTPDIALQPQTICDPTTNLKPKQFINASCLVLPKLGTNGVYRLPYARGPAFFNSDLSAQKSFRAGEKKTFQVRLAAFNFLNHPLTSLTAAGTSTPLLLHLSSDPNTAASTGFGTALYKQNRRVVEAQIRYNF